MTSVLKITDGTTTVDFLASAGTYRVTSWSPAVAGRRASEIGGRGPYEDVTEEMRIVVTGATAAASLETLQKLLDQAARWGAGEPVTAVKLHYKATTSSDELRAVILGPAKPGEPMIDLPDAVVDAAAVGVIDGVRLKFRRSGAWLGDEETMQSATAQKNPVVTTISAAGFGAVNTDSPYVLTLLGLNNRAQVYESFFLITSGATDTAATRILVFNAKDLANAGRYTSVSDSYDSVSGNVLRFTAQTADTTYASTQKQFSSAVLSGARRFAVFANIRNASTGTFTLQVLFSSDSTEQVAATNPITIGTTGYDEPRYAFLGMVSTNAKTDRIAFSMSGDTASQYVDFDSVVVMAVDNPVSDRVIAIPAGGSALNFSPNTYGFKLDHRLETHTTPQAWIDASDTIVMPYNGDISLWMSAGHTVVKFAWLGTGGIYSDRWRVAIDELGTIPSNHVSVARLEAFLIPR